MRAPKVIVHFDYGPCFGLRRAIAHVLAFTASILLNLASWVIAWPCKVDISEVYD